MCEYYGLQTIPNENGGEKVKDIYRMIGIYRITNLHDGKSYIGKTRMNFGDRWGNHKALLNANKHGNPNLQRDWNKYGAKSFEFVIVESVESSEQLNDLEIKYIKKYRDRGLCYNIADGGDTSHNRGRHLSADTKRKIGDKNRINMMGKKHLPETRRKMSEAQRNRIWTDEQLERHRENSRRTNLGRVRSEETKDHLRKINQENPPSAKFTPDDIRAIRQKKADGMKLTELAAEYKTSASYISNIVHGRRWGHIV